MKGTEILSLGYDELGGRGCISFSLWLPEDAAYF